MIKLKIKLNIVRNAKDIKEDRIADKKYKEKLKAENRKLFKYINSIFETYFKSFYMNSNNINTIYKSEFYYIKQELKLG